MRPHTYEDASESKLLISILRGRNGLQNTVFALLDPNGKQLTRGSRSPRMTYGSVERFVSALKRVSADYTRDAKQIQALPVVSNLRLALNVAAADLRPLVIVRGLDDKAVSKLAQRVAAVAWSSMGVGRFRYVVLSDEVSYEGLTPKLGVTVVQPEAYGRGGEVLVHIAASATPSELSKQLSNGLCAHDVGDKDHEQHVRNGRRSRIRWESETRSTDRVGGGKSDPGGRRNRRRD